MKLCRIPFRHEHIFDAKSAPRGQLPYIVDDGESIGDSDAIISHLIKKYHLPIDSVLTGSQRTTDLLIRRMLDDLYWVMSYSRWYAPQFSPAFKAELLKEHPGVTENGMEKARQFNFERYHYQGIGRYESDAVFERGLSDLQALANLVPESGFLFGREPSSTDAGVYGFLANIYFYNIDTPPGNLYRHTPIWCAIALRFMQP